MKADSPLLGAHAPSPMQAAVPRNAVGRDGAAAQLRHARLADASAQAIQLRALAGAIGSAPAVRQLRELQAALDGAGAPVQRAAVEEEEPAQRAAMEEEEPAQRAAVEEEPAQRAAIEEEAPAQRAVAQTDAPAQRQAAEPNRTGLPDNLKSGVEALSGVSLDSVRVHYNSPQPAQLNAHAYAQGSDIHVAPGQERHLPHEAWHVVQQAQGRVKPTMQMRSAGGTPVNDDPALESEADAMGARAVQMAAAQLMPAAPAGVGRWQAAAGTAWGGPVQLKPGHIAYAGGEMFLVDKSDLGTGTVTSEGTRSYVNDPGTYKPKEILFDYATASDVGTAKGKVTGSKYAYATENPKADRPYKSGRYWDAGHKLGRQNGGVGNEDSGVFPQNPAFNQGNSRNMDDVPEETHPAWRAHEDEFHEAVKRDGAGAWWVKLP
ncbi:eCIS core domain-containing protein [Derxia lacustris]|uniref:eCIS core domain-containing protein n=1 Tax=Derxia lacustris TaxID=764842 RepID=UPI001F3F1EE6|nr:DUF4157 domain-containing protein [Derxia lacustris]